MGHFALDCRANRRRPMFKNSGMSKRAENEFENESLRNNNVIFWGIEAFGELNTTNLDGHSPGIILDSGTIEHGVFFVKYFSCFENRRTFPVELTDVSEERTTEIDTSHLDLRNGTPVITRACRTPELKLILFPQHSKAIE